jgi:hypothetical protein
MTQKLQKRGIVLQNLSIASSNSSNLPSLKTKYTIFLSGTANSHAQGLMFFV